MAHLKLVRGERRTSCGDQAMELERVNFSHGSASKNNHFRGMVTWAPHMPLGSCYSFLFHSPSYKKGHGTMVQNNQESRQKHWATRSSIRSYHSLVCLCCSACLACALRCVHPFGRLLASSLPSSRGSEWFMFGNQTVLDHSAW